MPDPATVEAGFKFGQELLRSGNYAFIEALSRHPAGAAAGAAALDERHVEEQFERGLWLLMDGIVRHTTARVAPVPTRLTWAGSRVSGRRRYQVK